MCNRNPDGADARRLAEFRKHLACVPCALSFRDSPMCPEPAA